MFFLLYRETDDSVFDDFSKISEVSPKLVRRSYEHCRTFAENFKRRTKVSTEFKSRRCFDLTPVN